MLGSSSSPLWLQVLFNEKFFNACVVHEEEKKNEKNILCLDCCTSICTHCLSFHNSHRLLQIRRYVYHDVLRIEDASRLMDCAFIQSYTTNSSKVIFINQRSQTRQFRTSGNLCRTCDRSLQNPYIFCSIFCKVSHLLNTQQSLSKFLVICKFMPLPETSLEDSLITPDPVFEQVGSIGTTSSGSSGNCEVLGSITLLSTAATTEIVRKKRSSLSCRPICPPISEISASLMMNRRKKTPQRAPLY